MNPVFDPTISFGSIITGLTVLAGVVAGAAILKSEVRSMGKDIQDIEKTHSEHAKKVEAELKDLNTKVALLAVHQTQISNLDSRVVSQETRLHAIEQMLHSSLILKRQSDVR